MLRTNLKGTHMQVTYFKTYSSKSVRKAIEKLQFHTLELSGLKQIKQDNQDQSHTINMSQYGTRLRKTINQNRQKLVRSVNTKPKFRIRPEVLKALVGSREVQQTSEISIKSLPLKKYSNQDAFRLRDRQRNVLKYLGNDRDPYFQLRHNNYFVVRS